MTLLINLIPVKAGGGLQNALSFLTLLDRFQPFDSRSYKIIVNRGTVLESFCHDHDLPYYSISNSLLGRFYFEFGYGFILIRRFSADTVFSLFGGPPIISTCCRTVSGFAYSNIIQPEVPFWNFLPPSRRFLKLIIDKIRLWSAKKSDEIILETEYLAQRASRSVFPTKTIHTIKMAPSAAFLSTLSSPPEVEFNTGLIKIIYVSGAHENKRIHLLADVFRHLNQRTAKYVLVTTLPAESKYFNKIKRSFENAGALAYLENIGPVAPTAVAGLMCRMNAVINVALLESFSNNWVEAWAAGLPLITTDADWSRASCGEAATYVDPTKPKESAERISKVLEDNSLIRNMKNLGTIQLSSLPSSEQRFWQYISIISTPPTENI